jgi:hypothetical protein
LHEKAYQYRKLKSGPGAFVEVLKAANVDDSQYTFHSCTTVAEVATAETVMTLILFMETPSISFTTKTRRTRRNTKLILGAAWCPLWLGGGCWGLHGLVGQVAAGGIVLTHEGHAAVIDHVSRPEHAVVLVLEALDEVRELGVAELDLLDAGGVPNELSTLNAQLSTFK